jgi:hypothetical protein
MLFVAKGKTLLSVVRCLDPALGQTKTFHQSSYRIGIFRIPSNGTENGAKEISRDEGTVADNGMDVRASQYVLLFRGLSGNKGGSANASFEKYQQTPVFVNLGFSERILP